MTDRSQSRDPLLDAGPHTELTIPATARRLCGITDGSRVLLAASPTQRLLVLHSEATITALLCTHHTRLDHADDRHC